MKESEKKKEKFLQKMSDILNYGALNLAMAIGYEKGLFEAMDEFDAPESAWSIAEKADLSPRYVLEWLSVMTAGRIIDHVNNGGESLFFLPKEHADFITRRAQSDNLGVYTQEVPLLTRLAMKPVGIGFETGQGVDYLVYKEFFAFMTELADAKHKETLIQTFLPFVDHGRIVKRLHKGICVCDLGCGEGTAVLEMAREFPNSDFTGLDISIDSLEKARKNAKKLGIANAKFTECDAACIVKENRLGGVFDYVTAFDSIHDQTRPDKALLGVFHMLRSGGSFSMVDIKADSNLANNLDHPMGPFLYTVSMMHCMAVGLVDSGMGLGMMWGRQKAQQMLENAGFSAIQVLEIPEDTFNLHFFCRK